MERRQETPIWFTLVNYLMPMPPGKNPAKRDRATAMKDSQSRPPTRRPVQSRIGPGAAISVAFRSAPGKVPFL